MIARIDGKVGEVAFTGLIGTSVLADADADVETDIARGLCDRREYAMDLAADESGLSRQSNSEQNIYLIDVVVYQSFYVR